jgi:hypothetical protein
LLGDSSPFDLLVELLEAIFNELNSNQALELLVLTEYIQAEFYVRHSDELRALVHPDRALMDEELF